jgi:hypothetical protein
VGGKGFHKDRLFVKTQFISEQIQVSQQYSHIAAHEQTSGLFENSLAKGEEGVVNQPSE